MPNFRKRAGSGPALLIFTVLLGAVGLAGAASDKKSSTPPPKPAPAAKPAPAGNAGAGASHGTGAGGAAPHGPTANGGGGHGPTANGGGAHSSTTQGTGAHSPGNHSTISTPAPKGSSEHVTPGGSVVRTRQNGKPSDVHNPRTGTDVHHTLTGGRKVSTEHADHSRVVSERGRRGYVQHPYSFHGHDYGRRTYYYHGRAYDRFYRGHYYRGAWVNVYAPGYYYGPGFYGWVYNPWAMAITFGWGWGASPWYGYYGYYFAPYPSYPSASYWLTDYMISSDLQASYAARQEGGEMDGAPPPAATGAPELTPDVKNMIADEVKGEIALENQEAQQNGQQQDVDPNSSGIARLMSDGHQHVFVAGGSMDLVDATSGQECSVSDGDALLLAAAPDANATAANLVMLSSKGGQECAKSQMVTVQMADLQEMQNHMREAIDQGLQELQAREGRGGVPMPPPAAQGAPAQAAYATAAPPQDANVADQIQQQAQQGDQTDQEAGAGSAQPAPSGVPMSEAPIVPPVPSTPPSVALGQSPSAVKASLGTPVKVADLGPKKIFFYDGMKVTFLNGKVTSVN